MMKRPILASALLLMVTAASGCVFYGGGGDDDPPCDLEGDIASYRDPVTGNCGAIGGGGCGGATDSDWRAPEAFPDMAQCPGACEALDEQTCLTTSACRAAYLDDAFLGCWGTAPSGPVQGGQCGSFDAWECSRHDDCTAHYTSSWDDGTLREAAGIQAPENTFSYCAAEEWGPGCYSDMDCPAGWECSADVDCLPSPGCDEAGGFCDPVCYGRCQPAQNGCELVDCAPGYHCELQCAPCDGMNGEADPSGGNSPQPPPGCDAACEITCVPDQTWGCEAILCGPDTHCETICSDTECPPGADCPATCYSECVDNLPDPGSCTGDVLCDAIAPSCPPDTLPGIRDGCWSGYCIPLADCDLPNQTCESLDDQASCAARTDCQPVYSGSGCTCYPDGNCSCEDWSYLRCETLGDDPVMPF